MTGALLLIAAHGEAQPAETPAITANAPHYYTLHCAACHDAPDDSRAPSRAALSRRTPEAIYEALSAGAMAVHASDLSDGHKRVLATFLSGRPLGSVDAGDAGSMANRCAPTPFGGLDGPMWNGWGRDGRNSRFPAGTGADCRSGARTDAAVGVRAPERRVGVQPAARGRGTGLRRLRRRFRLRARRRHRVRVLVISCEGGRADGPQHRPDFSNRRCPGDPARRVLWRHPGERIRGGRRQRPAPVDTGRPTPTRSLGLPARRRSTRAGCTCPSRRSRRRAGGWAGLRLLHVSAAA